MGLGRGGHVLDLDKLHLGLAARAVREHDDVVLALRRRRGVAAIRERLRRVRHRRRELPKVRREDKRVRDRGVVRRVRRRVRRGGAGDLRRDAPHGERDRRDSRAASHHADDDVRRGDSHRRRHVPREPDQGEESPRVRVVGSRGHVRAVARGHAREERARRVRGDGRGPRRENFIRGGLARRGHRRDRRVRVREHADRVLPGAVAVQRGHVRAAAERGVQKAHRADRSAEPRARGDGGAGAVFSHD
mmetsp:Transcript_15226/g.54841  ORF Transcript_15226/g.54841 Transcript_15226/m.54841 type:complete len:247 (-) Transcript_15226:311-1051(-)